MRYENDGLDGEADRTATRPVGPPVLFDDSSVIHETMTGTMLEWLADRLSGRHRSSSVPPETVSHWEPAHLRSDDDDPHHCPPRLNGWSLILSVIAVVVLAYVTISSGAPAVGLVACGGLAVSVCALVAAEIVSHRDIR